MRDGVPLITVVQTPAGRGPWPAVLTRAYSTSFNGDSSRWLAAGYACVAQQTRNEGGDDGTRFFHDGRDGYDTIEWIAARDWCDGQVAMFGKSYWGITQWLAALEQPPHLRAIIPQNYSMDSWKRGYRAHGAVTLAMTCNGRAVEGGATPDRDWYLQLPLAELDSRGAGRVSPLWRDYVGHNEFDDYWQAISVRSDGADGKYGRIQIPVFIMGGWWDYYAGQAFHDREQLLAAGAPQVRVAISATDHVDRPPRGRVFPGGDKDEDGMAIGWLDRLLKGVDDGIDDESPIHLYTMVPGRQGTWRFCDAWPPAGALTTPLYLSGHGRGAGQLVTSPPAAAPPSVFRYDPSDPVPTLGGCHSVHFWHPTAPVGSFDHGANETRPDVLAFTGEPLTRDTEVTGPLRAILHAATDGADTDWTVMLLDVEADGTPYNVSEGIVRARFRDDLYGPAKALSPGQAYEYEIELAPTSHVFAAGHRICVHVSSSNFPLWDRNPNTGGDIGLETRTRVATQTIYHDRRRPSRILLPIVEPPPA
jgi:hypothetical protein